MPKSIYAKNFCFLPEKVQKQGQKRPLFRIPPLTLAVLPIPCQCDLKMRG